MNKRQLAGEIVGQYARYLADAPEMCYHVRLNGLSLHSDCTAKLADRVADAFTARELWSIHAYIQEQERGNEI